MESGQTYRSIAFNLFGNNDAKMTKMRVRGALLAIGAAQPQA
jgi:hypothetical protein